MLKDILRETKAKWFQFLAIVIITMLGVGFFIGIQVTGYDMRETADLYMEESSVLDLELRHTLGIDEEMIESISNKLNSEVVGIYDDDSYLKNGKFDNIVKVVEYTNDTKDDLRLIDGRLPLVKNETAVDNIMKEVHDLKLGDTLTLAKSDVFTQQEITIVGFVESSLYLNLERGHSRLGSGSVSGFIYPFELEHNNENIFTAARIRLNDELSVEDAKVILEGMEEDLSAERFDRVIAPDIVKLVDAQKEIDKNRTKADDGFLEADKEIQRAEIQLDDAKHEIESGLIEIIGTLPEGSLRDQLAAAKRIIAEKEVEAEEQFGQIDDGLSEADASIKERIVETEASIKASEENIVVLEKSIIDLEKRIQDLEESEANTGEIVSSSKELIKVLRTSLDQLKTSLESSKKELETSKETLVFLRGLIDTLISEEQRKAEEQLAMARRGLTQIETGIDEYEIGISKLAESKALLESEKKTAYLEINKAQKEVDDAYIKIQDTDKGKNYVLERKDVLIGYNEFYADSDRIEAIGKVFPLLFFGVAVLVTLSTVSRMIDESRMQIGVYKALGYSSMTSAMKFVGFTGFAWFIGSFLGVIIGFYLIPTMIYNAYRIMYQTPELVDGIVFSYAWLPLLFSFAASVGVALFKSLSVSREKTAELLRPPMPKDGQRIFLERIPFIWNRLGFLIKVSLRNLFRNKTRFLMTIMGIGGSFGLLITGFGLQHSIYSIVEKQFDEIVQYDGMVIYDEGESIDNSLFDASIDINSSTVRVNSSDVSLFVSDDMSKLSEFVLMRDRKSGDRIKVDNDTVVVTEKLAIENNLKVGDMLTFTQKEHDYEFAIGQIAENYVFHYIFMPDKIYESISGIEPQNNVALFNTDRDIDALNEILYEDDSVLAVSHLGEMRATYQDMMGNFDVVIWVIVGAAFALELIVLLNLITMNLSERYKEMATLKVLGFYPRELSAYLLRENFVLTIFSLIIGAAFGKFLHHFVIINAEIDAIMFNRELLVSSYLLGAALTLGLSIIINLIMARRANKVNMSEALKTFDA